MTRPRPSRHTGRRAGESGTREAILDAARQQFADRGYDRATIRGIAAAAGVDPALVHHYYGSKEQLFAAAMRLPVVPSQMIGSILSAPAAGGEEDPQAADGAGAEQPGPRMVRAAVEVWDSKEVHASFVGLLRSALTNENAAAMLREFVASTVIGTVAGSAAAPGGGEAGNDARYRASLAASQMVGLAVMRYVLKLDPIVSASAGELAAAVGPSVQRYLTGDIGT
jgi:AcrR family transcriptional regulator